MMSFTAFDRFCDQLKQAGLISVTASDALRELPAGSFLLKHDVEANVGIALRVAQTESNYGHRATFYVHGFFLDGSSADVLKKIQSLGHEIGYHYDVLDDCDGDYEAAESQFSSCIRKFERQGFCIKTICPHGNPLKCRVGWRSNKDFFKKDWIVQRYPDLFDIVNQSDAVLGEFAYYSDAGFKLRKIGDIRSNDASTETAISDGAPMSVQDLIRSTSGQPITTVVSIHPHRLSNSTVALYVRKNAFLMARATVRLLTKVAVFRRLLSPLYRFAKKF